MTTISDFIRVSQPILIKRSFAETEGTFSGYASTFGGDPDSYGDVIAPGAFAASLARHKANHTTPLMLWSHNPDKPIGSWTDLREDQTGLFVRGEFRLSTSAGRDAYEHVKAGDLNGLSIGYRVLSGGSKAGADGVRLLTSLELEEASIVAFPANRAARVTDVKSFGSRADLEKILREHLPARAVKKLLSGGWSAVSGGDDDQPDPETLQLMQRLDSATAELRSFQGKSK